ELQCMITLLRRRTRSVRRARKTRILASVKSSRMLPFFHYLAGFVQIGANLTSTVSTDQERCWASSWRETGSNQGGAACLTLPSRKLRLRRPPGERWVKDILLPGSAFRCVSGLTSPAENSRDLLRENMRR